jgi:hypothetical protein
MVPLPGAVPIVVVLLLSGAAATAAAQLPGVPVPDTLADSPSRADPTSSGWRYGGRVALGVHQMREDLLTPLRFVGPGADLRLILTRAGPQSQQRADVRVGLAYDRDRYGDRGAAATSAARYAYLRRVGGDGARSGRATLGATAAAMVDEMYLFDWDDAHMYWMTILGVGPAAAVEWNLGVGRVSAELQVPTVGLVGRPPIDRRRKVDDLVAVSTWFTLPFSRLTPAAPPDLIAADARLSYARPGGVRWLYELSLRTTDDSGRGTVLEHLVGVEWSVGR